MDFKAKAQVIKNFLRDVDENTLVILCEFELVDEVMSCIRACMARFDQDVLLMRTSKLPEVLRAYGGTDEPADPHTTEFKKCIWLLGFSEESFANSIVKNQICSYVEFTS